MKEIFTVGMKNDDAPSATSFDLSGCSYIVTKATTQTGLWWLPHFDGLSSQIWKFRQFGWIKPNNDGKNEASAIHKV